MRIGVVVATGALDIHVYIAVAVDIAGSDCFCMQGSATLCRIAEAIVGIVDGLREGIAHGPVGAVRQQQDRLTAEVSASGLLTLK